MAHRVVSGLLIFAVAAVFSVAVWNFLPEDIERRDPKEARKIKADEKSYIQFDDWLTGVFRSRSLYPNWISGSEYVYKTAENAIVRKEIASEDGDETEILSSTAWGSLTNPSSYQISADSEYVAITYEHTDGYAHYMKTFSVAIFATADSAPVNIPNFPADGIQKIKWDPVGHKLAFVQNFNVYVVTEFTAEPEQITEDGEENVRFNGVTDWLFYVEITNDDALLWWSPSGTHLAYASIDEGNVKSFDFARFNGGIYPEMVSFPYPKPGTPIPTISTYIVDTDDLTADPIEATPSATVTDWGDYYLNSAVWSNNSIFMPTWKNRFENESVSETCISSSSSWDCSHTSEMETRSETGWLGKYKPADLYPMPGTGDYMTVLSNPDGFAHIAIINTDTNTKTWVTTGTFEVADAGGDAPIFFYDETNDWVYFTSTEDETTGEGLPRIRHMWRVKAYDADKTRTCLTCSLNTEYPNRCNWVTPSFSTDGSHVVVNCGGTSNGPPISTLHNISSTGEINFVRVVENNTQLIQNLEDYHYRDNEFGEITLPGVDGVFYYALHKPPNFDPNKKYPMLVQVYSGPGFQYCTDSFGADWARGYVACSELDVIVMTFDGRGTGFRGDKIMHMVYRDLGMYEPIDQIEAAKQVSEMHDFIDNDRIAIWGRSYGGYATSRVIAEDENNVFKCGFSVAPVTDWLTYHTIYTERYMGLPKGDNEMGYNRSTAIQKLENFGKHYFVLVHGTSDENVHFLNAARLSKALIEAEVDFSAYFAADETHGFRRGANGYGHHYKLLTNHLKICFGM